MTPHPIGLPPHPPPTALSTPNQTLPFHQRYPPPFSRGIDHPINSSNPQPPPSQSFPSPTASVAQNYPAHALGPGALTSPRDQPSYIGIRPSPPKPVYGTSSDEIGSFFQSPSQALSLIRPSHEQPLFNRGLRGPFDNQPNPSQSLYGNLTTQGINWKNPPPPQPPETNLGPSPPHLKSNNSFRGIFNSPRPLDVPFKEGGTDFHPQNYALSLHQSFSSKTPKENVSPLTMFMDNANPRSLGNTNATLSSGINQGGNILQQIASGPNQSTVSNIFEGATQAGGGGGGPSTWWNKESVGGPPRSNAYSFSQANLRSSYHGGTVSPSPIDTSVPPPNLAPTQFQSPAGLAIQVTGTSSPASFSSDGNNILDVR